jgi:hypothetical protein
LPLRSQQPLARVEVEGEVEGPAVEEAAVEEAVEATGEVEEAVEVMEAWVEGKDMEAEPSVGMVARVAASMPPVWPTRRTSRQRPLTRLAGPDILNPATPFPAILTR